MNKFASVVLATAFVLAALSLATYWAPAPIADTDQQASQEMDLT